MKIKDWRKEAQGTNDQLLIGKMILKKSKVRRKNLTLGWINYKKAYDIMPHPWILEYRGFVGKDEIRQSLHQMDRVMDMWT